MSRLSIDYDLDYEITPADIADDVHNKIDFFIERPSHIRAAKVLEESEEIGEQRVGIQFTISASPEAIMNKWNNIARVKPHLQHDGIVHDLILVALPIANRQEVIDAISTMQESELPFAPDRLLSTETQEALFRHLLEKVYGPDEIDSMWSRISSDLEYLSPDKKE
jgi:hypothetical protein